MKDHKRSKIFAASRAILDGFKISNPKIFQYYVMKQWKSSSQNKSFNLHKRTEEVSYKSGSNN